MWRHTQFTKPCEMFIFVSENPSLYSRIPRSECFFPFSVNFSREQRKRRIPTFRGSGQILIAHLAPILLTTVASTFTSESGQIDRSLGAPLHHGRVHIRVVEQGIKGLRIKILPRSRISFISAPSFKTVEITPCNEDQIKSSRVRSSVLCGRIRISFISVRTSKTLKQLWATIGVKNVAAWILIKSGRVHLVMDPGRVGRGQSNQWNRIELISDL